MSETLRIAAESGTVHLLRSVSAGWADTLCGRLIPMDVTARAATCSTCLMWKAPGPSNALFVLACGCTLDGFHDCDPARKWAAGVRNAVLYCSQRGHGWQQLTDVVSVDPLPVP